MAEDKTTKLAEKKISFTGLLIRFHVVIFALLVLGSLTVAIFYLYKVILSSDQPDNYTSDASSLNQNVDEALVTKLRGLRSSDQPAAPLDLSNGRIDPF